MNRTVQIFVFLYNDFFYFFLNLFSYIFSSPIPKSLIWDQTILGVATFIPDVIRFFPECYEQNSFIYFYYFKYFFQCLRRPTINPHSKNTRRELCEEFRSKFLSQLHTDFFMNSSSISSASNLNTRRLYLKPLLFKISTSSHFQPKFLRKIWKWLNFNHLFNFPNLLKNWSKQSITCLDFSTKLFSSKFFSLLGNITVI